MCYVCACMCMCVRVRVYMCVCVFPFPSLEQMIILHATVKGKGKAVPLQAWTGPDGSGKLRFPDFVTMAQDGGKVVSLTHRPPLPPGNTPGTHLC